MTNATITERQRYRRDHVLAAAAYSGSIVEYAEANNLKTLPYNQTDSQRMTA